MRERKFDSGVELPREYFCNYAKRSSVPQLITCTFTVAPSIPVIRGRTVTAICQIARPRRKSRSLLTFDARHRGAHLRVRRNCPFDMDIHASPVGYPRSPVSLIIPGLEWLFKDVTAFSWNFLCHEEPRNFLRECQRTAGKRLRSRPNFVVGTTLRNANICPSNLHEMRVNKQTKKKKEVLPCDTYR